MSRFISIFFVSALFTLFFTHNSVSKTLISNESVFEDYIAFETALNQDVQSLDIANFLHDFVAADAAFTMQLNNTENQKTENISIDKSAYINSFLQSRKYLENYNAEIKNIEVLSQGSKKMTIKHKMVETGMTMLPSKVLQPFTSITECALNHTLNDGLFVVSGGECSTKVSLNEDI